MTKRKRANKLEVVQQLPQGSDTWLVAVRRMRAWMFHKKGDDRPIRPYILLVIEKRTMIMVGVQVFPEFPPPSEALEMLTKLMVEPMASDFYEPHRPRRIEFEQTELAEKLVQPLADLGVKAVRGAHMQDFNEVIRDFEARIWGVEEEVDGLLSAPGMTPKIAETFFAAAAGFYRAGPWILLGDSNILAVRVPPDEDPWYLQVMGQAGVEYGLLVYRHWEDIERVFQSIGDPQCDLPSTGWHSISFEDVVDIPIDDLEAIERYGWEVAGEGAYPFPVIFDTETAQRPVREELLLYEKLLRVTAVVVREHLVSDGAGDYRPIEAEVVVPSQGGRTRLEVRYPAGTLKKELHPYSLREHFEKSTGVSGEWRADEARPFPPPDRRALEGTLAGLYGGDAFDPEVQAAQTLMYRAWDEADPTERIRLARKALEISEDCADAYVLLAEEQAKTLRDSLTYFQAGVQAGERVLGEKYFEENVGYFWGLLETRPYMRARQGLANCLWELGQVQEAQGHYEALLRLNPNDNQGIRFVLLELLLDSERDQRVLDLLASFPEDVSTSILYTKALLAFRTSGESPKANAALCEALEQNPYVPDYLLERKRIPGRLPDVIGWGDESEAVDYAASHLNYWRRTQGAIDWVRKHDQDSAGRSASKKKRRKQTD